MGSDEELPPLWSAPFGLAAARLAGNRGGAKGGGGKAKLQALLSKGMSSQKQAAAGGRRASGDAPMPGMLHTRPRQVSGAL